MAKITGPLFSETARGTFGPRLTFSQRKSGQQARYQHSPKDYETEARAVQRRFFSMIIDWWQTLTATERAEWDIIGLTDC